MAKAWKSSNQNLYRVKWWQLCYCFYPPLTEILMPFRGETNGYYLQSWIFSIDFQCILSQESAPLRRKHLKLCYLSNSSKRARSSLLRAMLHLKDRLARRHWFQSIPYAQAIFFFLFTSSQNSLGCVPAILTYWEATNCSKAGIIQIAWRHEELAWKLYFLVYRDSRSHGETDTPGIPEFNGVILHNILR